jgi:DNA repair exonuclease SbcCD ATPase subunit
VFQSGEYRIERGRNASGKGSVKVYRGEDLIASGSSAGKVIEEEVVGMNAETFMLTAFFGLSDTRNADTLIKVPPSARLETLQKIAKVSIYGKLFRRADSLYKSVLSDRDRKVKSLTEKIAKSKTKRRNLVVDEDRYRALLREKDKVGVAVRLTEKNLKKQRGVIQDSKETITEIASEYEKAIVKKKEMFEEARSLAKDDASGRLEELATDRISQMISWIGGLKMWKS